MDSQLDRIIRDLPADYEDRVIAERNEEEAVDEIIRNLPIDFEPQATTRKRKAVNNESTLTSEGPSTSTKPKRVCRKEPCPTCGKEIRTRDMARHKRIHNEVCYDCPSCDYQGCCRLVYLRQHYRSQHATAEQYKCRKCGWQFASEEAFFEEPHLGNCIKIVSGENPPLEPIPIEEPTAIFLHDNIDPPAPAAPFWQDPLIQPHSDDEEVVSLVNDNWQFFRQHFETDSNLVHEYYYRTTGADMTNFNIPAALRHVYGIANATFNFNIGTTMLLCRDVDDVAEYRVFVAQNNRQNLFQRNLLVHNLASLDAAIAKVEALGDLTEYVDKMGSEWKVVGLLGVVIYVYLRPNFVAGGHGSSNLPTFLTYNRKTVNPMERDANGHMYQDKLCLFRCIVAGSKGDPHDKNAVLQAYEQYRSRVNGPNWKQFKGVPEDHMPLIEEVFNVNIAIYRKFSQKKTVCLRKATKPERPTVNVHSHPIDGEKVHFSLILNLTNFVGKHLCENCGKMFKMNNNLERHRTLNCKDGETAFTYKDACYEASPTIFDQMAQQGIFVERERQKCDSFIVWDMEACLEALQLKYQRSEGEMSDAAVEQRLNEQNIEVEYVQEAAKLQLRERHRPITGAIKSSIQFCGETKFFHNDDPEALLREIFEAMVQISDSNYEQLKEKFANEFAQLEAIRHCLDLDIANAGDGEDKRREKAHLKTIKKLERKLEQYCRVCTVLTFNGGRYDLLLCKKELFPRLTEKAREARNAGADGEDGSRSWPKAISRGSTILCLMTEELRFLDVTMYCPGTNLDKFVKTFNPGGDIKGVFPYELLRCPEDLHTVTEFPPKSSFYSTLKRGGITDKEYEEAKAVWDAMPEPRTLLKYVEWYNCRDVEPFLVACQNMHDIFWADFGIDIFRQAQSIPGVCLAYLFKRLHQVHPTVHFGLFNEQQGDLCQELYQSMTGGLAVIVKRWAEKGVTGIRGNPEIKAENVVGFDFNALYLWAMMQDTPAGYPDHWTRKEDGGFERKSETVQEKLKRRKAHGETHYMQFAAFRDGLYIHNAMHGTQSRLLGKYRVDGLAMDAKPKPRVYEYHGCKYHCHEDGCLNKNLDPAAAKAEQKALDEEKMKALTAAGFDVVVTWECHFNAVKRLARKLRNGRAVDCQDAALLREAEKYNEFLAKHPLRKFNGQTSMSENVMINGILKGAVFGFAKVDISTPESLKEAYSDFPPIIKHAEVSVDDIGAYMKGIADSLGQMKTPRKCLINSFVGEKIWIMTPLIQLYKEIGLEITKVHEVVEYDRIKMFEWFGDTVTEHRKQGDVDPDKATLGGIYKLLGNSAYGKTITNLARHMDVFYADAAAVQDIHNDPYHHRTVEITGDCFEIHKRKEEIQFNLPMQIGLSVYAWAKWKVLKFIYTVLQKYVPRDQYEFLESDTDSIYLALAKNTLKECVPTENMVEFEDAEREWFVLDATQLRTPGLLKVETEGRAFVGLSAKTYIVLKHDGKGKHSAKGVQYRNADILTYDNYKKILFGEGGDGVAFNVGIRPMKGSLYTYIQAKSGLGPLYTKRICQPDHTTLPLEI